MSRWLMKGEVYAIRHKEHGYMPQRRSGRGYTTFEPEAFHPSEPRLFWTRVGADRALRAWLKGCWSRTKNYQDSYTGEWDVEDGSPPDNPPANRKAEDMEIVTFTITEEKQ